MSDSAVILLLLAHPLDAAAIAFLDAADDWYTSAALVSPSACGIAESLGRVRARKPDVVVVDASVAAFENCRLLERLNTVTPATKIVVIDVPPSRDLIVSFIKAGAHGFVVRGASPDTYERTIRSVRAGGYVVPAELMARTSGAMSLLNSIHMTQRERDIATMMVAGADDQRIAAELAMPDETFGSHVSNILEKLVLHTRLQVAAHALHRPAWAEWARAR